MAPPFARRVAVFVWASMALLPLAFMGLTFELSAGPRAPQLADPLFWAALGASAVGVLLSRFLPLRLRPNSVATGRDVVAFSRLVVGWALCEGAAIVPIVARMVTGDPRLLAVFALDLVGIALLFPSRARWALYARPPETAVPARMVR